MGGCGSPLHTIKYQLDRGDLDTVTAVVLGAIKRMIGMGKKRRQIEHSIVADDQADTDGRDHRLALDLAGGIGKRSADFLSHRQGPLARRIDEDSREFFTAEAAENVEPVHAAAADFSKHL